MRKFLAVVVALGLAGFGYWYAELRNAGTSADAEPPTVQVARGNVEMSVLASGVIEAKSLVAVGARVSGQVETLAVRLGDRVKAGDLIAQLESLDQQNDVAQAKADQAQIEAQIASNKAEQALAELSFDRNRQLGEKNLISAETLETARATLAMKKAAGLSLEAQRQRAEIAVSSAELALERTRITAPASGTVVAVVTDQGQTVNASSATPTIVKIADLDHMVVHADISEADVVRVKPGQHARFTLLGAPDRPFDAILSAVEPAPASIETNDAIDTTSAIYYVGLLDVDNPVGELRIGMTAEVTILLDNARDVLTLPSSMIYRTADGKTAVEVWDPASKTRGERIVTVGLDNAVTAEIADGLVEGERVVTDRTTAGGSAAIQMRRPSGLGF